ncbi:ZP domain-containing protein, partial [Acropora cervicornis]
TTPSPSPTSVQSSSSPSTLGCFHHAIGVQDPSIIPDNQMTASSSFSSSYYAHFGRLHDIRGLGWAGRTSRNPSDWLQVDFGRIALVCAVATQGNPSLNEWVIDFSLSFSSDGASWMYSNDSQGNKMAMTTPSPSPTSVRSSSSPSTLVTTPSPSPTSVRSSSSPSTLVTTPSPSPTSAFIMYYDSLVASSSSPSTLGCFHHAIGVQDPSIIPDNQMTASSYYSSSYYAHFGRLHDIRGLGWAGRTSRNPSDWLQVDFGRIALVCAVATQGNPSLNEWVIDFSLSFSSDGASWMYSNDSQGNKMANFIKETVEKKKILHIKWLRELLFLVNCHMGVFTRMGNNFYVDRQTLPAPMSARYIRFHPISQHSWNTLRVEVYEATRNLTSSVRTSSTSEPGVTVSCGEHNMALSIEKQSFSFVRVEQVHLRYSSCKATENGTHLIISTLLNDCGTSVNETEHALLFWNEVQVDAVIIDGVITRSHDIRLPFYCSYSRKKLVSLSFNPRGIYFGQEAGYGNFTFKLDFFKSGSFVVPYSTADYPLELRLNDYLYVRYTVESSADLVIMAENCRATKDGSFYSLPHYNIIKNGCGRDTTMIYSYNSNRPYQEFRIKVFRFFNGYSSIYLHCELLACHRSSINSSCQRGCLPGRRRKRRAVIGDGTEHVESTTKNIVSRGPLIFKDEVKQGDTGQSKKQGALIGGVVGAGAVCVLAFAALGIVFVKYRVARRLMNRNKVGDL